MWIIGWIVLGAVVGWIASTMAMLGAKSSLWVSVFVGAVGGVIGGLVLQLFGVDGITEFNIWSYLAAIVAAVFALWIWMMSSTTMPKAR